ncbi:MAG TPA: amino acid adenylation domain-containing protein [Stellaceae bacterium]|jgi:D-alanine--poly(phosphoribitol) ligase subunit 1|nr:amino acid adenylation domain-containing protein [Stellaceae bacterium]
MMPAEPAAPYRFTAGQIFSALAAAHPSRPALRLPDRVASYGELDAAADRVAHMLRSRGIGRRNVVGIVHTKTLDAYATMLACLKSGAVYVNLDETNPAERLERIFSTCRPRLVVGDSLPEAALSAAASVGAATLDWAAPEVRRDYAAAPPEPVSSSEVTGADPAYIMYTSGSTGTPKGAVMTHANVLNFAAWARARFSIGADDVLTNVNPMYFDNSVFDFYAALLNGAALAPVPRALASDAQSCVKAVEAAGCTVWFSVPSMLIYLMSMKALGAKRLPTVRAFVFGGEGYPKPELRRLHDMFGNRATLINVYGPTECTCICSARDIEASDLEDQAGLAQLGPVTDNFDFLVLDEEDRQVAPGEVGELWLLGPQVALGYYNDPERTALSFRPNPVNPAWVERCYRTGDLVRLAADGRALSFVGRKDNQIKHMGYRIELEEIEAALYRMESVAQAAVVYKPGQRGFKHIVAYVAGAAIPDAAELRRLLRLTLPDYMIPQRFETRGELPRNANGKVDRRSLAETAD